MLGLNGYDSSDEEIESSQSVPAAKDKDVATNEPLLQPNTNGVAAAQPQESLSKARVRGGNNEQAQNDAPLSGPQLGPAMPPNELSDPLPDSSGAPSSPYTSSRQAIRNLTLPPVPNFSIPPSPPGSPPPGSNEKFARFLELKKKGLHFNEKLENSSALRNPNLLTKLREFAGISDAEQYQSSLPEDLAVPTKFPDWAYTDHLNRLQAERTKALDKERKGQGRDALEFVPALNTVSGSSSRNGTPGATGRIAPKSAAERVMRYKASENPAIAQVTLWDIKIGNQTYSNSSSNNSSGSGSNATSNSGVANYTITSTGTNSQGNHYCSRDYGATASNKNPYHYSNTNGSFYYSNANGSTYYNDGKGGARYTPSGK